MKFLGIDYGTKRIGVAISDEKKVLAFPKEIVLNDSSSLKKLEEIIKTEKHFYKYISIDTLKKILLNKKQLNSHHYTILMIRLKLS